MGYKIIIPNEINLTCAQAAALLALSVVCFFYTAAGSETMTLTTYYPAPYGAYVAMLTTNQTLLARDGGNVGIGMKRPQAKLDVAGTSSATNLQVNGTAVENETCSPTGLIAQDGKGVLLSCQDNVWKKAMGSSDVGQYTFKLSGSTLLFRGTGRYDSAARTFYGSLTCDPIAVSGLCGSGPNTWCGGNTGCAAYYASYAVWDPGYSGWGTSSTVGAYALPVINAKQEW